VPHSLVVSTGGWPRRPGSRLTQINARRAKRFDVVPPAWITYGALIGSSLGTALVVIGFRAPGWWRLMDVPVVLLLAAILTATFRWVHLHDLTRAVHRSVSVRGPVLICIGVGLVILGFVTETGTSANLGLPLLGFVAVAFSAKT
jgi:hypothetical protein